jgi:hypothetical protein
MGDGSVVELGGYIQFLPYAVVAALMALSLRWRLIQQSATGKGGLIALAVAMLLIAVLPVTRELSIKVLNGFYALIIDLRHLSRIDTHPRIQNIGGQFYVYYGILKKSLLESLPYLGLAVFAVVGLFRSKRRAAYALCLILPLIWFMPFILKEWIGGRANNLRYFSPMLPLLSILGAIGWRAVVREKRKPDHWSRPTFAAAIVVAFALLYLLAARIEMLGFADAFFVTGGAQWFGLVLFLFALAWLLYPALRARIQLPFATLAQAAFVLAFVAAYVSDATATWGARAANEGHVKLLAYLEPNAHVFADGQFALYFLLTRPDSTLAFYKPDDFQSDLKFIDVALDEGRPVYVMTLDLTRVVRKALQDYGYNDGPRAIAIERSISPADGQHYGLYRLHR